MYCSKVNKSIIFFLFFTFITIPVIYSEYYDGSIKNNIFLSETSIYFHDKVIDLQSTGEAAYRSIYNVNNGFLIAGVNFILHINNNGKILNKKKLPLYIDFSYVKDNKLYFGMKNSVYILNMDLKNKRADKNIHYEHFYYRNNKVKVLRNIIRTDKKMFYFDDKNVYFKNTLYYFPQSIKRVFIFDNNVFIIDINGDVYLNGAIFIGNNNTNFIKMENGHLYFFGDRILNEKKEVIRKKESALKGLIYTVFQDGEKLYISTYDGGIILWNNGIYKTLYHYNLLSGISNGNFVFRNGNIVSSNGSSKVDDEILKVKNNMLFGKNGIYDINSKEVLFSKKNFYFSDYNISKKMIASYKKGLFTFVKNKYIEIKTNFQGVKEFFIGKYIIANNGIYSLDNKKLIIKGAVNSIYQKNGIIYVSLFKKGIFVLMNNKLVKTEYSINGLNGFFTEDYVIVEMYHNIFIYNYEIFKK